jgi:hypothetical protein
VENKSYIKENKLYHIILEKLLITLSILLNFGHISFFFSHVIIFFWLTFMASKEIHGWQGLNTSYTTYSSMFYYIKNVCQVLFSLLNQKKVVCQVKKFCYKLLIMNITYKFT